VAYSLHHSGVVIVVMGKAYSSETTKRSKPFPLKV